MNDDHPWLKRDGMVESALSFDFDIPLELDEGLVYLTGIAGFEVLEGGNYRYDVYDMVQ